MDEHVPETSTEETQEDARRPSVILFDEWAATQEGDPNVAEFNAVLAAKVAELKPMSASEILAGSASSLEASFLFLADIVAAIAAATEVGSYQDIMNKCIVGVDNIRLASLYDAASTIRANRQEDQ